MWFELCPWSAHLRLYSLSGGTSYRTISWSLEAARLEVISNVTLLSMCLSHFRAIGNVLTRISRLRDYMTSYDRTSIRLVNRGPVRKSYLFLAHSFCERIFNLLETGFPRLLCYVLATSKDSNLSLFHYFPVPLHNLNVTTHRHRHRHRYRHRRRHIFFHHCFPSGDIWLWLPTTKGLVIRRDTFILELRLKSVSMSGWQCTESKLPKIIKITYNFRIDISKKLTN